MKNLKAWGNAFLEYPEALQEWLKICRNITWKALFHILLSFLLLFYSLLYFIPSLFFLQISAKKYETLLNHFWCLVHLPQWHCWTRSEYWYMGHTCWTARRSFAGFCSSGDVRGSRSVIVCWNVFIRSSLTSNECVVVAVFRCAV